MKSFNFKQLAQEHLDDARALQATTRLAGAIYLAGYAVECALKFRVCETLGWDDFPPSNEHRALKSHDLNFLLNYTGKLLEIKTSHLSDWQTVEDWNPEMRYETTVIQPEDCSKFIRSVDVLVRVLA